MDSTIKKAPKPKVLELFAYKPGSVIPPFSEIPCHLSGPNVTIRIYRPTRSVIFMASHKKN